LNVGLLGVFPVVVKDQQSAVTVAQFQGRILKRARKWL
jgi:hypothetical protein